MNGIVESYNTTDWIEERNYHIDKVRVLIGKNLYAINSFEEYERYYQDYMRKPIVWQEYHTWYMNAEVFLHLNPDNAMQVNTLFLNCNN